MNGLRRINSQRQEDLGLHNEKLQHFMFKWKKMSQCRSSQAQRRKNQEKGRLVYFLFLHTVLFSHSLMNYMTSLSVLLPRLNNSKLVLCFRWILVYSLLFVSSAFFWKTLYSFLWNVKKAFSEAFGSIGLEEEKKDLCKWLTSHLSSYITEGIITISLSLLEFCNCTLSQQDSLTLNTFLHSLYRDINLHFI